MAPGHKIKEYIVHISVCLFVLRGSDKNKNYYRMIKTNSYVIIFFLSVNYNDAFMNTIVVFKYIILSNESIIFSFVVDHFRYYFVP